ncbi:MAG: hypothetical protein WCI66_01515 [Gammaproteobacteria bacterium]
MQAKFKLAGCGLMLVCFSAVLPAAAAVDPLANPPAPALPGQVLKLTPQP